MKKRNRNIIVGLVIILLIYMFIIKPMMEKPKKTTNGNGNGNGNGNIPLMVDCCFCDGGSPVCYEYKQGMCQDGTTEMSKYEELDCGHGCLGA